MNYKSAYLAKEGLKDLVLKQLNEKGAVCLENLILSKQPYKPLYFVQNGWKDVQVIPITSIKDGARKLKALGAFWAFYPTKLFRRGELILSELPKLKNKPFEFMAPLPKAPIGSFTLLDENTLIASSLCTSPFPNGAPLFVETKFPPSRAYLKLYEILTLLQKAPTKDEVCLELGAAPGSWTWLLSKLSKRVIAVDRAPLDEVIMHQHGNIDFKKGDAFKMTPEVVGPIDWLFSDIICYPEKLLEYLKLWLDSQQCKNFVCTIKFQGEINFAIIKEFEKIEGSHVVHLYHNKHELTWYKLS